MLHTDFSSMRLVQPVSGTDLCDMTSASAGRVPCHNISDEYRDCADQTGCGTSHSAWGRSWDVEACRQIVYSTSTDNISDMFPAREWGPAQLTQYCEQTWNITPQTAWFRPWLSLTLCWHHFVWYFPEVFLFVCVFFWSKALV